MAVPQTPASAMLGKYELVKETTASSIATTWLGREPDGGNAVSILRLHRHVSKRQEVVDAFLAAVRAASGIVHPHILRIIEASSEGGEVFVVQEVVEGDTLAGLLRAAGAEGLPVGAILRIAKDVAGALDAAHASGLSHGELGPWNVVTGSDGSVKLAGLGVASALARIGLHGLKNVDRLAYAAPERVKGMAQAGSPNAKEPDPASDLFSLGSVLWEAFAKERLFQSKMEAAVVQKVLTAAIEPIGKRAPGLPSEIEALVDRCLEREPEKRPESAKAVLELLRKNDELAIEEEELGTLVEKLCGAAIRARREDAKKVSLAPRGPAAPKPRTATLLGVSAVTMAEATARAAEIAAKRSSLPKPAVDINDEPTREISATADAMRLSSSDLEEVDVEVDVDTAEKATPPKPPQGRSVGTASPSLPKAPPKAPPGAAPGAPPKRAATIMGLAPVAVQKLIDTPKAPPPKIQNEDTNEITDWESIPEPTAPANGAATPSPAPAAARPKSVPPPLPASVPPPPPPAPEPVAETKPAEPAPEPAKSLEPSGVTAPSARPREIVGPIEQGTQLGSYEVLMTVARGGMASVWAGRKRGARGIDDLVAIKTLLPELGDDLEFHKMFRDETRVASRIRHPNVAALYAVGEHGETPYLVMEWVDGDTLAALLRAAKPLGGIPQGIVLRIASAICAGLHAAHELRDDAGAPLDVVHRDITPANVLLTTAGEAKVVDFGVAKSKSQMHVTRVGGVVKGKTPYLSPEQLGGLPLDRRSDLFSFGTMLYVLTTGLHPFRGDSDLKTLENIAIKKPVPLRSIVPWIDPAFETLVLKLLEKDPRQRLASAEEVKGEVDRILESLDEPNSTSDVASFQRKALGEALDQRSRELATAAEAIDAKRAGLAEPSKVVIAVPMTPAPAQVVAPPAREEAPIPQPVELSAPDELPAPIGRTEPVEPFGAPAPALVASVPPPRLAGDGLAEEPLEEALARGEDTKRNQALQLRRRRLMQVVGLVVAAGVVTIAAAALLSGGDESTPHGATSAPAKSTAPAPPKPTPPPPETAEPAPTPPPTAEPAPPETTTPSAEPPPAPTPPTPATTPPTTPPTTPKTATPPTPQRPPPGRPPGRPPKKPPIYNPQGI